jgi:very-short-patch-repair endonuclease
MDDLELLLTAGGGAFSSVQASRLGVSRDQQARWCRTGVVVRVRRGAFVDRATYARAGPDDRYRLRVRAVMAGRSPDDLATHHAALALRGVPLWMVDLARIDIAGSVSGDFVRAGVWVHPSTGQPRDPTATPPAVTVARALVQVATATGVESAVVAADAALARQLCSRAELDHELSGGARIRASRRVATMLRLCDARSESVGETRLRLMLVAAGLPVRSQVRISDGAGVFARVDLLVEDRVVVEFDGAVKYSGDVSGRTLFEEKRREDRLRELGFEVVRVTWADLERPQLVLDRVRAAIARARARTA